MVAPSAEEDPAPWFDEFSGSRVEPILTLLAGWGFLNNCFGVWPKLLMKPIVALRCKESRSNII